MQGALFAVALALVSITEMTNDVKLKVGMRGGLFPLIALDGLIDLKGEQCGNYFITETVSGDDRAPKKEMLTFFFLSPVGEDQFVPVSIRLESRFVVPYLAVPLEEEFPPPVFLIKRIEGNGPLEMIAITLSLEELERSPCLK